VTWRRLFHARFVPGLGRVRYAGGWRGLCAALLDAAAHRHGTDTPAGTTAPAHGGGNPALAATPAEVGSGAGQVPTHVKVAF